LLYAPNDIHKTVGQASRLSMKMGFDYCLRAETHRQASSPPEKSSKKIGLWGNYVKKNKCLAVGRRKKQNKPEKIYRKRK